MPRPGGGVMSRASAGEIARIGVLVRIPPALRSYTAGEDEVVRRGPVLGGCRRVPHGPRSEGRADRVRGRAARRGTLGSRGVPRANRERAETDLLLAEVQRGVGPRGESGVAYRAGFLE